MVRLRDARPSDADFLLHAVALAADWRPGTVVRASADVLASPDLAHYVSDWPRPRDRGVVAEEDAARPVGAAWWRLLPQDDPGYGFVAADVPEVSLAIVPERRGQGLGGRLLSGLVQRAQQDGYRALSLSVEPDNPALRLYRRLGFTPVGTNGGAVTMLLDLRAQARGAAAPA